VQLVDQPVDLEFLIATSMPKGSKPIFMVVAPVHRNEAQGEILRDISIED
jgi:hypothetical protein